MIGVGSREPPADGRPEPDPRPMSWHALDLRGLGGNAERTAWVALSLVPGMGPVGFAAVLHRFGSAKDALRAGVEILPHMHRPPAAAEDYLRRHAGEDPAGVLHRVEAAVAAVGGRVITAVDDAYPGILCQLDPRPPVLYVAGSRAALEGTAVAVVGTRRASGYGRASAIDIADALARAGMVVVSGLAIGIDGEAHRAALDADGISVAVLPSPLDRIYPPRHADLARRIVATGGALVSELPPGVAIGRPDFARRNRLIAGLSSAVVVVEAPDRSGALLTAALAISLGRELYAVPGPIDAVASRGCNRLIADQSANIVTSSGALLRQLGAFTPGRRGTLPALSEVEGLVLGQLLRRSASIEELMGRVGMPAAALASALTLLEARGLATSYGGATFHPTLLARGRGTAARRRSGP